MYLRSQMEFPLQKKKYPAGNGRALHCKLHLHLSPSQQAEGPQGHIQSAQFAQSATGFLQGKATKLLFTVAGKGHGHPLPMCHGTRTFGKVGGHRKTHLCFDCNGLSSKSQPGLSLTWVKDSRISPHDSLGLFTHWIWNRSTDHVTYHTLQALYLGSFFCMIGFIGKY